MKVVQQDILKVLTMTVKEAFEIIKGITVGRNQSKLFPPKTASQISEYESNNKIHIPESYKEWLIHSNGGRLFGGYVNLYGIDNPPQPAVGNDFSDGRVPNEYLILGYMEEQHICCDKNSGEFFLYEYVEPTQYFKNFADLLEYIIDICLN